MLNAFYNFTHYTLEKCWIVIECLPKSLIKHSFDGNQKTCLGYAILVFVGWHRSWAVTSVTMSVSPRVANTLRKFPCCITVSSHEHYGVSNNRYIDSLWYYSVWFDQNHTFKNTVTPTFDLLAIHLLTKLQHFYLFPCYFLNVNSLLVKYTLLNTNGP